MKNVWNKIEKGWKVDKVKFKYILKQVKDAQKILDHLAQETTAIKYWESKKVKECRHNFILEQTEGTFYVGIESNQPAGTTEEKRKTLILEYNPNKTNPFSYEYLSKLKELELHRRKILYIDLAFDMEIDINILDYEKRRTNERWGLLGREELETIYLGTKGTNGAVKIYDKVKELNKNILIDTNTGEVLKNAYTGTATRYEISIKPENDAIAFNIPNPFLFDKYVKLHNIGIKTDNEKILTEIEKYNGADFTNLIKVHLNRIDKINKNYKKKYKDLYREIKKSCTSNNNKYNKELKNFNNKKAFECLTNYLKDTTIYKDNPIILENLS